MTNRRKTDILQIIAENGDWAVTFDAISDMILVLDEEFCILRANHAYLETYGKTMDEIRGRTCYEVTHGNATPCANCKRAEVLSSGEARSFECHDARLDRHFDITDSPIFAQDGSVCATTHIMKDITDRKQAEEQRVENERLRAVLELSGAIRHELNQPLQVISGYADMLLTHLDPESDAHRRAHTIKEQARRMADILKKMSRIARCRTLEYMEGETILDLASSAAADEAVATTSPASAAHDRTQGGS